MKRSERLYRWLLRLYPRDFRDEYGQEMSLLFRARATDGCLRALVAGPRRPDASRAPGALEHDEAGSAVRGSAPAAQSWVRGRRRRHAGARDRWNHGGVQRLCTRCCSRRCRTSSRTTRAHLSAGARQFRDAHYSCRRALLGASGTGERSFEGVTGNSSDYSDDRTDLIGDGQAQRLRVPARDERLLPYAPIGPVARPWVRPRTTNRAPAASC